MESENRPVLVVDDDREINAIVGAYVELCGLSFRQAYDGISAIDKANHQPAPVAIVLDLMLPDLDGFEVCRRLKSNPTTKETPVIILSALGSEADKKTGREAGAEAHLTKPFDPDEFMRVLKEVTSAPSDSSNHH